MVLALAPAAQAAPVALTSANVTYTGVNDQDIVSIDGLNFDPVSPSDLVFAWSRSWQIDTKVGGVLQNNHTTAAAMNADTTGKGYLTDDSINTTLSFNNQKTFSTMDIELTTPLIANNTPDLNAVAMIMFEAGGNDDVTFQAFGGTTALGSAITISTGLSPDGDWGDTGVTSYGRSASGDTSAAVGLSLGDLGASVGDQVTKIVMTYPTSLDVTQVYVNGNLEPSTGIPSTLIYGR